jgi:DNA-binding transcriptional LysR family regulator
MELRHLRYFVAVAEELHFSRAAARLNIAAPTLSAQIQALETSLGAQLFTRKTRSVALTHVGKRFLEEARATLKQASQAELVGRRAARGDTGSLAVGYVLSAVCGGFMPAAIDQFRRSHPDVSFQLNKMETIPQMKALSEGALDIAFARAPDRYPAGLTGFVIERQPFWLAMPEGHRLAAHKEVTPDMFIGEDFVATLLEMEMGFWSNMRVIPSGTQTRIVTRVPDALSVLAAVASGMGIAVLSASLTRIAIPGVAFRKISKITRTSDHAVVVRKNEGAPVVKAFVSLLRAKARKS